MTEHSARLALPLLQAGQAQKELYHNEALMLLDGAIHPAVAALVTTSVPLSPVAGESWIVGPDAGGAWAGKAAKIATWTGGGWRFIPPLPGIKVWLKDRGRWVWHDGSAWVDGALPCAGLSVDGRQVVGTQKAGVGDPAGGQNIDIEARAAVSAILAALRSHGLLAT